MNELKTSRLSASLECGGLAPLLPRAERAPKIFITDVVMKDVSATTIRQLAGEGRTDELVNFLPGPVLEYIKKYGIYKN